MNWKDVTYKKENPKDQIFAKILNIFKEKNEFRVCNETI
jgi:hypothetical protein